MSEKSKIQLQGISIHAPRKGGDLIHSILATPQNDFNPRPPRGGRRKTVLHGIRINLISIHAPREGGDDSGIGPLDKRLISIHAPREGGDLVVNTVDSLKRDFNPRPPRGGRLPVVLHLLRYGHFNPRPPRGGRPQLVYTVTTLLQFQSTPPARGATAAGQSLRRCIFNFNPRPPRGGRLRTICLAMVKTHFNPRPPRGGRQYGKENQRSD